MKQKINVSGEVQGDNLDSVETIPAQLRDLKPEAEAEGTLSSSFTKHFFPLNGK